MWKNKITYKIIEKMDWKHTDIISKSQFNLHGKLNILFSRYYALNVPHIFSQGGSEVKEIG